MEYKSISRAFILILGGNVSATLVMLVMTPIIVRLLGSDGYGDYAFIISIFALLTIFYDIGLFDATRKFIAESPENKYHAANFSVVAYIIGLISVLIWSLLMLLFVKFFSQNFQSNPDMTIYFVILLFALGGNQLFRISRSILMGLQMENKSEILVPLQKSIFGLFAIILAYLGYGVAGVISAFALAFWIVGIICFKRVISSISAPINFTKKDFRDITYKLVTYGSYSALLVILFQTLYHVDIIMVRYFLTNVDTGYYRAALQTSEFMWFVPWALQIALLHSVSNMWANGEEEHISAMISKLIKYTTIFIILLSIGIFVLANSFLGIYFGSEFVTAKIPLLLLLPGILGFSIARIIVPIIQSKGELKQLIILMIGISSMNLILNYLLIPLYGIAGAAIATSISYSSMLLMSVYAAKKIEITIHSGIPWIRMSYVIIITLLVTHLLSIVIINHILKLIIIPVLVLLIYSLLIIKLKVLTIKETIEIIDLLPNSINQKSKNFFNRLIPILQ